MWKWAKGYSKVWETPSEVMPLAVDEFEPINRRHSWLFYRNGFFFLLAVLAVILGKHILSAQLLGHDTIMPALESPCGNTTMQARAQGCEFDLLSYSWLPQKCLDRETSAEFRDWVMISDRERGAWPFFTDEKLTNPVTDEDALSERVMPATTWTTWEEHLGHCVFLSRRMQRSIAGEFKVDPHIGNYQHTIHCTKEILKGINKNGSENPHLSYFGVYFGDC